MIEQGLDFVMDHSIPIHVPTEQRYNHLPVPAHLVELLPDRLASPCSSPARRYEYLYV